MLKDNGYIAHLLIKYMACLCAPFGSLLHYVRSRVYCHRGKGDTPRLGHSVDEHVRHPKQVAALAGLNVIDLAVGNMHCLAITDDGQSSSYTAVVSCLYCSCGIVILWYYFM